MLHYSRPIDLTEKNVLAIVAPDTATDNDELVAFAKGLDADLLPYEHDHNDTNSRQTEIRAAVRAWLVSKGLCA